MPFQVKESATFDIDDDNRYYIIQLVKVAEAVHLVRAVGGRAITDQTVIFAL